MNKYILLFFCLIANYSLIQSQEKLINTPKDSIDFHDITYKTIYQIELCDFPFTIELIEKTDGKFLGYLSLELDRSFEGKKEIFVGRTSIEPETIKKVIPKLQRIALESVKNCSENDDCVFGLDGVDTVFKIKSNGIIRKYNFLGLIPKEEIKNETPDNRKKAYEILNYLYKELDLELRRAELFKRLPSGRYSYWMGSGTASFKIE